MANWKFLWLLLWFCFSLATTKISAQTLIQGMVTDSLTGKPLAFVSLAVKNTKLGTLTDMDGKFTLNVPAPTSLLISYVGYRSKEINWVGLKKSDLGNLKITMAQSFNTTAELTVLSGANPANRIIRLASTNRRKNNPDKLASYSYRSHNKFYVTTAPDSLRKKLGSSSASPISKEEATQAFKMDSLSKTMYFFMNESLTEHKFKSPYQHNETVLATRTSGFKELSMATVASSFQPFSFYDNYIKILNHNYVNPLIHNSPSQYDFTLEDTLFQGPDTVFIISFKPYPGKNFEALSGVLYINTNGYAIQNVIASPTETSLIGFKMQQKYIFAEGKAWFPNQLNTDIIFYKINPILPFVAVGRTYLADIKINPPLKNSGFEEIEMDIPALAMSRPDTFWQNSRIDSTNNVERRTFKVLDSLLGKTKTLTNLMKGIDYLAIGKIPWGKMDLDLNRFINSNQYEGIRLGLGIHTSDRLSRFVSVGGYAGYGFSDKAWKYGTDLTLNLNPKKELKLLFSYQSEIEEPGNPHYGGYPLLFSDDSWRKFMAYRMDKIQKSAVALHFRPIKFAHSELELAQVIRKPQYNYTWLPTLSDANLTQNEFRSTELGFAFRYSYGEVFNRLRGYKIQVGNSYPNFYFKITQALPYQMGSQFTYQKIEARILHKFFTNKLGTTEIQADGGIINGSVPYPVLFNAASANFQGIIIIVPNHFQTMNLYNFQTDRYAALFLNHNFGNLIYNSKRFKPELVLIHNFMIGSLNYPSDHLGTGTMAPEKGYYEAGMVLDNILRYNYVNVAWLGIGAGVFYHYGPYSKPEFKKNLSPKISLVFRF